MPFPVPTLGPVDLHLDETDHLDCGLQAQPTKTTHVYCKNQTAVMSNDHDTSTEGGVPRPDIGIAEQQINIQAPPRPASHEVRAALDDSDKSDVITEKILAKKRDMDKNNQSATKSVNEETEDPNENEGRQNDLSMGSSLQIRNNPSSRTLGSTIVYRGSDARVEIASPVSETDATDPERPIVYDSSRPIEVPQAYLVESTAGGIAVEAEPIDVQPWYKKRWGRIMIAMFALMVSAVVLMAVFISQNTRDSQASKNGESSVPIITDGIPSSSPTHAPTLDPRPTLEVVRERDVLRCGIGGYSQNDTYNIFSEEWCRAIASVVLSNPNKIERVFVDETDRFTRLNKGDVDVLLRGDTYTLEREIREPTTKIGFTFAFPYFAGRTVYLGLPQFVACAESQSISGECSDLQICVVGSLKYAIVRSLFAPSFITEADSFAEMLDMLREGICNVNVADIFTLLTSSSISNEVASGEYVFGNQLINLNHVAPVMRNIDTQWVDVVNGAVEAVLRGSWNGVASQNTSLCPLDATNSLNINFLNGPTCVGTSYKINERAVSSDTVSTEAFQTFATTETPGLVWAPQYGSLSCASCSNALESGTLHAISQRGILICAVIDDPANPGLSTMGEQYCRAVAVAIFHDGTKVNVSRVSSFNESTEALSNGELDLVAGESRFGLSGDWSPDLSTWNSEQSGDYEFSTPYYYSSSDDCQLGEMISLVTAADDATFSSFVNAVVTATINAAHDGITRRNSNELPLMELFGTELVYMFRDVIRFTGNYDDIYLESHDMNTDADRGFNSVKTLEGLYALYRSEFPLTSCP